MEIKIGIHNVPRELVVTCEENEQFITAAIDEAVNGGVLRLTDTSGRRVVVPNGSLAYVEIGASSKGRVGFGA